MNKIKMRDKEKISKNIKKGNLLTKKAGISYLEIAILIISSFAFSYFIYEASKSLDGLEYKEEKKPNLILTILASIGKQITKPMIKVASAQEFALYTCKESKQGEKCVEISSDICDSLCKDFCFPGRLDDFSECKPGCCINPDGKCVNNAPKAECEGNSGFWEDSVSCDASKIPDCRKGCCVLGSRVRALVTEKQCEFYSAQAGVEINYFPGENEPACLARALTQIKGACVVESTCKFITEQECYALTNSLSNFHESILCTNPELNSNCTKTDKTTCLAEKDEVYFVDSCGNAANIYDASNINNNEYWNRVFSKDESCGAGNTNGNKNSKTCGNCAYMLGSKCGKGNANYGDNVCKDMSCYDAPDNNGKTKDRKNGESWCLFDGAIGEGKDLVGSRHFKTNCINGEVKVEPCADFRNEICTQKDIEENGIKFSKSECRINSWQECLAANTEDEGECPANDCFVKNINIDDGFNFDVCVPEYSEGFELKGSQSSKEICSLATQKCTVIYQKKLSGWKCVQNCDCETKEFSQKMNEFCTGLGDCGFKMNIAGKSTENYIIRGKAPRAASVIGNLIWQGNYPFPGNEDEFVSSTTMFNNLAAALDAMSAVEEIAPGAFGLTKEALNAAIVATVVILSIDLAVSYIILITQIIPFVFNPLFFLGDIALAFILVMILGIGKTKKKIVEFKCNPWQPPVGGDDCSKCNQDLKTCSKYRCDSLGAACKFMNEGTGNELCIARTKESNPPVISPWQDALSPGYNYEQVEGGIKITGEKECIQAFTPISFGITTDEASQCKYDVVHKTNFDDMEDYFGSNLFLFNHSIALSLPSVDYIVEQFVNEEEGITSQYIREKYGNLKFLVRCQDDWGNFNVNEYLIQVCVSPEDDITPPIIQKYEPVNNAFVAFDKTEQDLKIYTNEPADCKYTTSNSNKEYKDMENSFSCLIDLEEQTLFGWACQTNLNLTDGENKFYIRCKDKPWLDENNETRFENQESYEYVLKKSLSELKIDSIEPQGKVMGGSEPFETRLEVHTSGGAENGKAVCKYTWANNWIDFRNTISSTHLQSLNLFSGIYNIPVKCEDAAGNIAEGTASFEVELDTKSPKIIRVYNQNGLYIYTDEASECAYSNKNCNFLFSNGTIMSGGFSQEHSAEESVNTYYIKCRDALGNEPAGCSIKVKMENV